MMRKLKYNNVKTIVDGIKFDSKKEACRYAELKLLDRAGEISHLEMQPRYDFAINGVKLGFYKADFQYIDLASNKLVVEDVKSTMTAKLPVYRMKKKLMKALHDIDIFEV